MIRTRYALLSVVALSVMALTGCDDVSPSAAADARANARPQVIAEADGVRLWKVQDTTLGGSNYVYFTSRGDVSWDTGGKHSKHLQVPGAPE